MAAAAPPVTDLFHPSNNNASFSPVFQGNASPQNGDTFLGDLLTPEPVAGTIQERQQADYLDDNDTKDLSSSLARVAKSLGMAASSFIFIMLLYYGVEVNC